MKMHAKIDAEADFTPGLRALPHIRSLWTNSSQSERNRNKPYRKLYELALSGLRTKGGGQNILLPPDTTSHLDLGQGPCITMQTN